MTAEIERIEKEFGYVLEIEEQIPMWKIASVMGRNYAQIADYLEEKRGVERGVSYARYLDIDWEAEMTKGAIANFIGAFTKKWHFQAGIPTGIQLETSGLMNCRKIGKKSYIKTVHHGPYHKVGQTYKKMYAWAKERDEVLGDESIECYLNDPRETKKSMLETMVLIPVS